jgi:hypothetical protein
MALDNSALILEVTGDSITWLSTVVAMTDGHRLGHEVEAVVQAL